MAGSSRIRSFHLSIAPPGKFKQTHDGRRVPSAPPPFLPGSFNEKLYPGGNSFCYGVQVAHLLGATKVVALGFTMRSNTGYEHGDTNPVTNRANFYDDGAVNRVVDWCEWYEREYPGRVQMGAEWDGPLREVFDTYGQ